MVAVLGHMEELTEAGARLVECGAVRMARKSVASSAGGGIGESRDAAAPAVNAPALPPWR